MLHQKKKKDGGSEAHETINNGETLYKNMEMGTGNQRR
jgi:hypothetical protein